MIDSHCHLDDDAFALDLPAALARARAAGVEGCVCAGVDPDGWRAQSALALTYPGLWVMYGLHPRWVAVRDPAALDLDLDALAAACEGRGAFRGCAPPIALGEVGLDRSRHVPDDSIDQHVAAFSAQLAIARARSLPVVLHVVRAHGLALDWLRCVGLSQEGGVLHSYSGSAEMVPDFAALGLMFSFSGAVTAPAARKLHRAAATVPDDRLMIETDSPDLTPTSRLPLRNEPAFLADVCAEVARLRGQPFADVAALTARNTRAVFHL